MRPINCLWVEGRLSYIERVCLASMAAQGHVVRLHHYGPIIGAPDGVTLVDANDVLPFAALPRHHRRQSYALGADLFRYLLLERGAGLWLDADVLLLKPITLDADIICGWEDEVAVNTAVLFLPQNHPVLLDLLGMFRRRPIVAPWWPAHLRLAQRVLGLVGRDFPPSHLPWGSFGPRALTHFLSAHRLRDRAQPRTVFYPIHYTESPRMFDPNDDVTRAFASDTIAVHLWNEMIRRQKQAPPPAGSFLDQMCRRYGVDPTE